MSFGKLYGVGVGPGAPDLMTLRAVNTLRSADVLAIPRATPYSPSTAWKIAAPNVGEVPGQERVYLTFPMSDDRERVARAWSQAYTAIGGHLEQGRSVAFLAEGDPLLYSTFVYLLREAPTRWPGIDIEIVPGITSVTAVPAAAGVPLGDGQERIAILPAAYDLSDLDAVLDGFDTVVFMKIGPNMAEVVDALERKGLSGRAVYVTRATMAEQQVIRNLDAIRETRGDCFAMLVVTRGERSGLLLGQAEQAPLSFSRRQEAEVPA